MCSQLTVLPTDILNIILENITNKIDFLNFLKYLKEINNTKYIEIIYSINLKIKSKYKVIEKIEEIFENIETSNKMEKYIEYKSQIFNLYVKTSFDTMFFCNKLIEIIDNTLAVANQKKRFTNICSKLILENNKFMKDMNHLPYFNPKISIKNINIYLDIYSFIKTDLL